MFNDDNIIIMKSKTACQYSLLSKRSTPQSITNKNLDILDRVSHTQTFILTNQLSENIYTKHRELFSSACRHSGCEWVPLSPRVYPAPCAGQWSYCHDLLVNFHAVDRLVPERSPTADISTPPDDHRASYIKALFITRAQSYQLESV